MLDDDYEGRMTHYERMRAREREIGHRAEVVISAITMALLFVAALAWMGWRYTTCLGEHPDTHWAYCVGR